ncbi:MAG: transporter substrate-binding protein [Rhodospirillales bacterium]|nr:transporter substrate-binding protein [Rhodospirillales bacterium]
MFRTLCLLAAALIAATMPGAASAAEKPKLPILVPITGFLALEGTSQRNGALLAIEQSGIEIDAEVIDTQTSPEVALTALERALRDQPIAVVGPILGTQMLALIPRASEAGVPLLTISGTAQITEMGSEHVFRFFPGDAVVKRAQARYAVEELHAKRPAILYQTTAYGQSGRAHLVEQFESMGAAVVYEEGVAPTAKDLTPALSKALAARPDVLILHLHAPSTALAIRQARALGAKMPIVAGSAMHQPQTAALLEPTELAGVCAESGSSPISGGSPKMEAFAAAYRARFGTEPDAFAAAQYDGTGMALAVIAAGADTPAELRDHLARERYEGVAMAYRSDGKGNMAHDAVIICYDGQTHTPKLVKRYEGAAG